MLVSGLWLTSLFREAEILRRNRLEAAKHNFEHVLFYDQGLLMLRNDKGEVLFKRGKTPALMENLNDLHAVARVQNHARGRVNTSAMLPGYRHIIGIWSWPRR